MIDTGYLLFGKPNQFVTMHVWWAHYFLNLEEDLNFKIEFDFGFYFSYVFLWNCRFQRPPGAIPSSLLGLEAVTGSLDNFGFEDYLNGIDVFELWLCRTNVFDFTSCTFYKKLQPQYSIDLDCLLFLISLHFILLSMESDRWYYNFKMNIIDWWVGEWKFFLAWGTRQFLASHFPNSLDL